MPDVSATRALEGRRILITRPRDQSRRLATLLQAIGATAIVAPAIAIALPESWTELDDALGRIEQYDWLVVTSVNAAAAVRERIGKLVIDPSRLSRLRLAAVGQASASPLASLFSGGIFVAQDHRAEGLARELPMVQGSRMLFPRGDVARDVLPASLRARGAVVDTPIVYRTVPGDGLAEIVRELASGKVDAVIFASPSAVHAAAGALRSAGVMPFAPRVARPRVFCLGPVTAAAARECDMDPDGAGEASTEDLVTMIAEWYSGHVVTR